MRKKIYNFGGPGDKLNINDPRTVNQYNEPLAPTKRKNPNNVNKQVVEDLVKGSYDRNLNPFTTLAIGLQETNLGQAKGVYGENLDKNPLHYNGSKTFLDNNALNESLDFLKEKNKYATKLGKTNDADKIQAWNGYGKLREAYDISLYSPEDEQKFYGKSLKGNPIDFNKTPVYGDAVVNLRDSVIQKNPELVNIANKYAPSENKRIVGGQSQPMEFKYGGQMKKKFYAFGSDSTNTVGAPTIKPEKNINTVPSSYTDDFSNKTRSKPSFDMGVPSTNFNQSGYIGAATAAATGIANTVNSANAAPDKQSKDNAITYGTVDTTMNVVGSIFPVVGAIEGAADAGKAVVDSTNPTTTVKGDDGKVYSFKEGKSGDNAAAWSASYNPVGNISNFIGDISGSTENYGRNDFGMALGDLFLPFVTEGLRNQDAKEAYSKSIIPNYTSGDSSMKAYAFGGPMPVLPKGVNPINKFTDFKDSTFKTHKNKGVEITPNDEVEKNESMYRFGRTKKATGGSSDGGYVFSHILGEDEQGNVSVVPQGSKAPKGWKSYADMSREAMS